MPALDGAGASVVRVASVARCWCAVATGVGGAEVDGLGDVENVAADVSGPYIPGPSRCCGAGSGRGGW